MPQLNEAELTTLRHCQPPEVEWFVAVAPHGDPVFEARVDDAGIARGAREIEFDGGVGVLGLVEPGMTLWIGSTGSAYDFGSARIRWITGSTFGISENDDILWADDLFLTVPGEAGFREPWSVFPRMVETNGAVTFYKDYDLPYDNEGDHLPPKANAGPPAIAFIDPTSGLATLNWIGEDSYATELLGDPLVAWSWEFPDGTPAASALEGTRAAPIAVTWDTPGFRYVTLTVEDTLGTTGTTHIPVWIFDEDGPTVPWRQVEVIHQEGSTTGGWKARLKVFGAGPSDFPDRSLVVLGIRTWYKGTRQELGGYQGRENIRFAGWVDRETLTYDATAGAVEFEAVGLSELMRRMAAFSLYLEEAGSPGDWYELLDNNADRMSHHILEFQSTINQIAHVNRPGEGNTRKTEARGFPDTNLFAQLQDNLWVDTMATIASDRQGILQITVDPQMMVAGDRNGVAVVCTLIDSDWLDLVDVPTSHVPELGFVELGGFGYGTPYLSQAPGAAPLQQEQATRVNGCILDTADPQTNANWWSGLTLTKKNTAYPELPLRLKGFWPVFDPTFQEWVRLNFSDPDSRHPFENARFLVKGVSFQDDPEKSTTITQLTLESESEILSGETVEVPDPPPPHDPDPPPGPIPPPVEPPIILEEPDIVFVRRDITHIYRTGNWSDLAGGQPTWVDITGVLTNIRRILVDQTNRYCYAQCDDGVWRIDVDDTTPVWLRVFNPATDLPANTAAWYSRNMAITVDGYIGMTARAVNTCAVCVGSGGNANRPIMLILHPDGTLDELLSQFGCNPAANCCPFHAAVVYWSQGVWSNSAWHMCSDLTALYMVGDCREPVVNGFNHICAATRGDANYVMTNEGDPLAAWGGLYQLVALNGYIIGTYNRAAAGDIYRLTPGSNVWVDLTPAGFHKATCYGYDRDIIEDYAVVTDQDRLYYSTGGVFVELLLRSDIGTGVLHHCSCYYDDIEQLFLASDDDILWTTDGCLTWSSREGNLATTDYREIRPVWTEAP